MITKVCSKCGIEKGLDEFHADKFGKHKRKARCKKCIAEYMIERVKSPAIQEANRRNQRRQAENRPELRLLSSAKERAKRDGIVFTLQRRDVVIPETCPIFGIPLRKGSGVQHDGSPSLDRIDPEKGYLPDNIAVVSYRANRLKNDGTALEHRLVAAWMLDGLNELIPSKGVSTVPSKVERNMTNAARRRAKSDKVPFEIKTSDIVVPEVCPVLGIRLVPGKGWASRHDGSPTLDRMDPTKGYVLGNISVISCRANRIKNNGTAEEHLKIADWMDSMVQSKEIETEYERAA